MLLETNELLRIRKVAFFNMIVMTSHEYTNRRLGKMRLQAKITKPKRNGDDAQITKSNGHKYAIKKNIGKTA